ncbi:flagellar hook-basal body complex protein FliE [bacterium]|nr:flagellar hook-basal body complex protein FliE [bacterium]
MEIKAINPSFEVFKGGFESAFPTEKAGGGDSFMSYLNNSMSEVNQLLNEADVKATELATGKTENLHESMIAAEKAEVSFKLMSQFRAKAIEAYNEIMRMQV